MGGGYLFYRRKLSYLWVKHHLKECGKYQDKSLNVSCDKKEVTHIRYLSVGFDDLRLADVQWLAPLFEKFGYRTTFNKILYAKDSRYERKQVRKLISHGNEIGCHTIQHEQYPYFSPLFNGQDPHNDDGSGQTPFPSNEDIRREKPEYTDEQCQNFRNELSLIRDDDLGASLDLLSHYYLGTKGRSYNSWDKIQGCYTGGIFSGCKTSENHEVWERIFEIQTCLLRDMKIGACHFHTWSWPGSKNSWPMFMDDRHLYFDGSRCKLFNNNTKFRSSLTGKERSLTDVLRQFGFTNTHDTIWPGRIDGQDEVEQRIQLIFNAWQTRKDALLYPTTRTVQYKHCRESEGLKQDQPMTEAYKIDKAHNNGIYESLENLRHDLGRGIVAGGIWDTSFSSNEKRYWKTILDYCKLTNVKIIPKRDAYNICFQQKREYGNLIYNASFNNTLDEFLPGIEHPNNPDGWIGDCEKVIEETPVLSIHDKTSNKNYGLPYGNLVYNVEARGKGMISYSFIRNRTKLGQSENDEKQIEINSNNWNKYVLDIPLEVSSYGDETERYEGMGDRIIGIEFKYQGEIKIRNLSLVKK